jgi:hypothetical protein
LFQLFDSLKQQYPGKVEIKVLDAPSMDSIKDEVESTVTVWRNGGPAEPAYIVHYIGHAMLLNQAGKLALKKKSTDKIDWVNDGSFASLFSSMGLDVRPPSIFFFQACDSAKIGMIDNTLRGVAYECTRVNIPAVVGMQNEINTTQSCTFYYKVYESLLAGNDVAEAVTIGRDHLGTDHKDYAGRQFQPAGEPYKYNYFGSPVLFITTDEPIRMIKVNAPGIETTGERVLTISNMGERAAKLETTSIDNDNPEKATRAKL